MKTTHATALRAITHADQTLDKDAVILDMDAGQFADWKNAELVREATDAEVARAKGTPTSKPKAARKPRVSKPAPAADATPATDA